MDKFVRKNFLALWCVLAIVFAVAKKLTIFQQAPKKTETSVNNSLPDSVSYWRLGATENSVFVIEQTIDSLKSIGEATLLYSIVPFNTDAQVQSDSVDKEAVSALILNKTVKIGNNSNLNSVFSPQDIALFPHALKAVCTTQKPEGSIFSQLSLQGMSYQLEGKGYLKAQILQDKTLKRNGLEDELWTLIRLDTNALPKGEFEIIPSLSFCQAQTIAPKAHIANAKILDYSGIETQKKALKTYELSYPNLKHTLKITFEATFPHKIVAWEEINANQIIKAVLKPEDIVPKNLTR
jgi:hypothetical protein